MPEQQPSKSVVLRNDSEFSEFIVAAESIVHSLATTKNSLAATDFSLATTKNSLATTDFSLAATD